MTYVYSRPAVFPSSHSHIRSNEGLHTQTYIYTGHRPKGGGGGGTGKGSTDRIAVSNSTYTYLDCKRGTSRVWAWRRKDGGGGGGGGGVHSSFLIAQSIHKRAWKLHLAM